VVGVSDVIAEALGAAGVGVGAAVGVALADEHAAAMTATATSELSLLSFFISNPLLVRTSELRWAGNVPVRELHAAGYAKDV
jgi:hypothetical protein